MRDSKRWLPSPILFQRYLFFPSQFWWFQRLYFKDTNTSLTSTINRPVRDKHENLNFPLIFFFTSFFLPSVRKGGENRKRECPKKKKLKPFFGMLRNVIFHFFCAFFTKRSFDILKKNEYYLCSRNDCYKKNRNTNKPKWVDFQTLIKLKSFNWHVKPQ